MHLLERRNIPQLSPATPLSEPRISTKYTDLSITKIHIPRHSILPSIYQLPLLVTATYLAQLLDNRNSSVGTAT